MKKMILVRKVILILLSLSVLCVCGLAISNILTPLQDLPTSPPANSATSPPPTLAIVPVGPTPLKHWGPLAIVQCRYFIKDRLVSPSSAEFSYEEAYKVNGEPMNYHAVTGIVESQNRMGVLLRSEYRCDVHYLPNDPMSWVLDHLDIED